MSATAAEMSWEDIKALFRETDRKFQETDRKFQETDRKFQETEAQMRETDRKFQETEAQMRETDRKMREVFDRFDNLSRSFGDLGNRLGEFVEAMVEPAVVELFRQQGLDVSEVHPRSKLGPRRNGVEVDLLVIDGDTAVAVECKSHLTEEDVQRHVERLGRIKAVAPRYRDTKIHGAVAGMVVDEDAVKAAEAAGLWVLVPAGGMVVIGNPPGFTPKVW